MEKVLRDSPLILAVREAEAPEPFTGKVRLYSIRYRSDDCEVEGYAAFPLTGRPMARTYIQPRRQQGIRNAAHGNALPLRH